MVPGKALEITETSIILHVTELQVQQKKETNSSVDISQCDSSVTGTYTEERQLDLTRISAKAFTR